MSNSNSRKQLASVVFVGLLLVCSTGCIARFAANMIHAAHGNLVDAKCDALEEKKVAVVCVSATDAFGPRPISAIVAEKVGRQLSVNVKEVEIVDQQEIEDWIDKNDWNEIDFPDIGKDLEVDRVLAIDLNSFGLYEGKTMYKGRADVSLVVYDIPSGKEIFSYTPSQIQWPRNTGTHTTDLSENEFRRRFVDILSRRIARHFHAYDATEDFAQDSSIVQ